jgi:mono/diheme cytochrome c family protein
MTTNTHTLTRIAVPALGLAVGLIGVAPLGGCHGEREDDPPRQFLPDMDDSPKFKPQTETEFFADGRAMRPRVAGTVPFGDSARAEDPSRGLYGMAHPEMHDGIDHAVAPAAPAAGQVGGGVGGGAPEPIYLERVPASAVAEFARWMTERGQPPAGAGETERSAATVRAMIDRGRERFNIYCSACHGFKAEGGDPAAFSGGIVGRRWTYPVPSLQDPKYRDPGQKTGRDGYIFSVIRNGVPDANPDNPPKMPSYADKVNVRDAWAIVSYVRTLQAAWQDPGAGQAPATPASAAPGGQGTGSTGGAAGNAGARENRP